VEGGSFVVPRWQAEVDGSAGPPTHAIKETTVVERSGYTDGEPCWADVVAPDVEAGKRFYEAVLDWTFVESAPEFGGYVLCFKDGKMVAGMSPPQPGSEGVPPAWSLYLWASDADTAAKRIQQAGGTVVTGPMEIPDNGRMVFAFDPAGAAFGLWEPGRHRGSQLFGDPGALSWAELNTREPVRADAFYQSLFGYRQEQIGDGEKFDYTVWKVDDREVCGRLKMTEEWGDMPAHWNVYFGVDDCDAAAARVTANGGVVREQPFDSPYGRIAVVSDVGGATFSLIDMSRRSATAA
jgi:predicted enzyme related to lactoylglutathione lyase